MDTAMHIHRSVDKKFCYGKRLIDDDTYLNQVFKDIFSLVEANMG
jgi:hypothetical protein